MLSNPRWCIPIHELKILYFQIPKCANTSILLALGQITGWDNFPKINNFDTNNHHDVQEKIRKYKENFTARENEKYKDYYKFTFVRNPYDRAVSCWNDKFKNKKPRFTACSRWGMDDKNLDFRKYCEKIISIGDVEANDHFRSQSYCVHLGGRMVLDWYGKIERGSDWAALQEKLHKDYKVDLPDLLQLNKVDKKHYSCYYNDYTKRLINHRYEQDISLFNYDFEELSDK